jgi:hypothetical protein
MLYTPIEYSRQVDYFKNYVNNNACDTICQHTAVDLHQKATYG